MYSTRIQYLSIQHNFKDSYQATLVPFNAQK